MKQGQDYEGVKSDLEMLNEITAYGVRKQCDRPSLVKRMGDLVVDMNITRLIKYGLVEEIERGGKIVYKVPDHVFKAHY